MHKSQLPHTIQPMHAPTIMTTSLTPLAEWELQNQIEHALSNKLTGQIQIAFLNSRTESIFVQHGVVENIYVRNHRTPDLNWQALLTRFGRGTLLIEPLPARALMFRKIVVEKILPVQPVPAGTNQLKTMFSLAEHNETSTLFHVLWEEAEGFLLIAGGRIPIRHAVLITATEIKEGDVAFDQILAWQEPRCNVMVHRGDIKMQAWLELHLNILFEWYCRNILNYYTQLTGVVMVKSILQNLSVLADNRGWNISTQNQQLTDVSLFPSAQAAGQAYREIISYIRMRIEPVIGPSLTQYLMDRSMEQTRGIYKTLQETFFLVEDAQ